jgi:hypothetical protein
LLHVAKKYLKTHTHPKKKEEEEEEEGKNR